MMCTWFSSFYLAYFVTSITS